MSYIFEIPCMKVLVFGLCLGLLLTPKQIQGCDSSTTSGAVVFLLLSHIRLSVTPWTGHARLPCPSLSHGVCSNSGALRQWCYLTMYPLIHRYCTGALCNYHTVNCKLLFLRWRDGVGRGGGGMHSLNKEVSGVVPDYTKLCGFFQYAFLTLFSILKFEFL